MRKALFVGGTGTISSGVVRRLCQEGGWEVWLLNRGNRSDRAPAGVHQIVADIRDETAVAERLKDMTFDVVSEFIGFTPDQAERDWRLFRGKTRQYIFVSSASAYRKPAADYRVSEGTALSNPYWAYSRNKIACEEFLMKKYREEGFPVTIVRPSHTYDERNIPLGVVGNKGPWQVIKRMQEGKPVLIQGDGTSLWKVTFNEDFAVAYTGLMGNRHAIGEAFTITSDETLTWNQIYETIADALGVALVPCHVASDLLAAIDPGFDFLGSLVGDKSNSVVFDNHKVKSLVPEFTTRIPFHVGVRRSLDYLLSHPERQVEDPEFDAFCDRVVAGLERLKGSF